MIFRWCGCCTSDLLCMLSDPLHHVQNPKPHPPPSEAGWTTASCWCTGFSLYLNVPSSTHLKTPCPPQPVSHVFCTALCVCHVHVDTSSLLLLSPLLTSTLILSIQSGFVPSSSTLFPCYKQTGTWFISPFLPFLKMSSCHWVTDICICGQMLDWGYFHQHCTSNPKKAIRDGIHLTKWIILFSCF